MGNASPVSYDTDDDERSNRTGKVMASSRLMCGSGTGRPSKGLGDWLKQFDSDSETDDSDDEGGNVSNKRGSKERRERRKVRQGAGANWRLERRTAGEKRQQH